MCGSTARYFAELDECVPNTISETLEFLNSLIAVVNVCNVDGPIVTAADVEALRYCEAIKGSLILSVTDPNADLTALTDLRVISGNRCYLKKRLRFISVSVGALVVQNSTLVSLDFFPSLYAINGDDHYELDGHSYSLVVTGIAIFDDDNCTSTFYHFESFIQEKYHHFCILYFFFCR
jgi:hypothetical protein